MPLPPHPSTEPAPQDTGEKWKTSGTGHLCCNGIPVAQFIEPVCQDGRYIPQALNLLAGHDLSQVAVVKKEVVEEVRAALLRFKNPTPDGPRCEDMIDSALAALASLNAGGEV